jgi:TPR repeat protein
MRSKINNRYLGLLYCVCNDIENAYFYLNRAAKKGDEVAIKTINELKEKKLLPQLIKENQDGFRFSNTSSS